VLSGFVQPPHWPRDSAIRVWIDATTAPPGAAALVEKALQTWTRAADGRFTLSRAHSRPEAVIFVSFASGDRVYGETAPHVDRSTRTITSADVAINTSPGDAADPRIVYYLTALHELGHALGLAHTDDIRDIMFAFREPADGTKFFANYRKLLTSPADIGAPSASGLSTHDVDVLRALYDR
jgi:hypothetical protein